LWVSTGRAEPTTGSLSDMSSAAVWKLITSMKNVINWNTMSRIGVRFGSAESAECRAALMMRYFRIPAGSRVCSTTKGARVMGSFSGARRHSGRRRLAGRFVLHGVVQPPDESIGIEHRRGTVRRDAIAEERKEVNGGDRQGDPFECNDQRLGDVSGDLAG